jgi:hypothetical protein
MMFRLFCEWDIGQENVVFASHGAAYAWLARNQSFQEIQKDGRFWSTTEVFNEGLIGFRDVEVID